MVAPPERQIGRDWSTARPLTAREREVAVLRLCAEPTPVPVVAQRLGISRSRVTQLERAARLQLVWWYDRHERGQWLPLDCRGDVHAVLPWLRAHASRPGQTKASAFVT